MASKSQLGKLDTNLTDPNVAHRAGTVVGMVIHPTDQRSLALQTRLPLLAVTLKTWIRKLLDFVLVPWRSDPLGIIETLLRPGVPSLRFYPQTA